MALDDESISDVAEYVGTRRARMLNHWKGIDERFQWYTLDTINSIPLASAQGKVLDVHCKV